VYMSIPTAKICKSRRRRRHLSSSLRGGWKTRAWHCRFDRGGDKGVLEELWPIPTSKCCHFCIYSCFLAFNLIKGFIGQVCLVFNVLVNPGVRPMSWLKMRARWYLNRCTKFKFQLIDLGIFSL
jgi:hypothetical protein